MAVVEAKRLFARYKRSQHRANWVTMLVDHHFFSSIPLQGLQRKSEGSMAIT